MLKIQPLSPYWIPWYPQPKSIQTQFIHHEHYLEFIRCRKIESIQCPLHWATWDQFLRMVFQVIHKVLLWLSASISKGWWEISWQHYLHITPCTKAPSGIVNGTFIEQKLTQESHGLNQIVHMVFKKDQHKKIISPIGAKTNHIPLNFNVTWFTPRAKWCSLWH